MSDTTSGALYNFFIYYLFRYNSYGTRGFQAIVRKRVICNHTGTHALYYSVAVEGYYTVLYRTDGKSLGPSGKGLVVHSVSAESNRLDAHKLL